jgi:hypothetical protein
MEMERIISKNCRETAVYATHLMLRALAPQDMTAAQQREASEQLGKVAAALARSRRRLAGRAHAVATMLTSGDGQPIARTQLGASRRPSDGAANPFTARRAAERAGEGRWPSERACVSAGGSAPRRPGL